MVNTEQVEEIPRQRDKVPFQYQAPKIRASFRLQVVPDMLTSVDLPEKTTQSRLEEANQLLVNCNSNLPLEGSLPGCNPQLPSADLTAPDLKVKTYKPCISVPPTVNHSNKHTKTAANKSKELADDDKDFEIPLEESLKAVEDFIKREKELSKWQVGEDVLAKWKGNGLYYKARILEIFPSGVVTILFDSYDVKEDIDYHDMSKYFKKSSHYKKKGEPASTDSSKETVKKEFQKHSSSSNEINNDQISLKHHSSFNSVAKRQKSKKKILFGHHKGQKITVIKSKKLKSKNKMCVIHPTVSDKEIKFYCPWG